MSKYYSIFLLRRGCNNRPFYRIVVATLDYGLHGQPIEQLGAHDPMPNERNEIITTFNFDRIRYWMSQNTVVSTPVAQLLGLAGFFPIHPRTYMNAWRNRRRERIQQDSTTTTQASSKDSGETMEV